MFRDLPWFIRKKIIFYAVSYDRRFSLLNKEYFTYCAGWFMILDNVMFIKNLPSKWFKLAGKLYFYEYTDLNWEFLNDCHNFNSIEFTFYEGLKVNFEQIQTLIWNPRVKKVHLDFDGENLEKTCIQLLEKVSNQLLDLTIRSFNLNYEKLFQHCYPNIISFTACSPSGSIHLDEIVQTMPIVEYLSLGICEVRFKQPSKDLIFHHLKTLSVELTMLNSTNHAEFFNNIFKLQYPELISVQIHLPYEINTLDKISQSMPKLKTIDLVIFKSFGIELFIPIPFIPQIQELNISYYGVNDDDIPVQIELSNIPQLRKLTTETKFNLINSNLDFSSHITYLKFKTLNNFPYKNIFDNLKNINELQIDCTKLKNKVDHLIKLCGKVAKLSMGPFDYAKSPKQWPAGSFKITHLELIGSNFLTYELLNWLANQPQLTHLTLRINSRKIISLRSIRFPQLHYLNISCLSEEVEDYLKNSIYLNQAHLV